jgi:DNA-binding YbaB/EbfC family protein
MAKYTGGFDMQGLVRQAQMIQKQVARVREELKDRVVEGTAGGGAVIAYVTGEQEVVSVKIKPEVANPGELDMLQDLVAAAVNEGLRRSRELRDAEMKRVSGGLGIPGIF